MTLPAGVSKALRRHNAETQRRKRPRLCEGYKGADPMSAGFHGREIAPRSGQVVHGMKLSSSGSGSVIGTSKNRLGSGWIISPSVAKNTAICSCAAREIGLKAATLVLTM